MKRFSAVLGLVVAMGGLLFLFSCRREPMEGSVRLKFSLEFDASEMQYGNTVYEIASGEKIYVNNIQFFISDVFLVRENGERAEFETSGRNVHYVDSDVPETQTWKSEEKVPTGVYAYVEFVYGLESDRNRSHAFVNPPESEMFWPESLGGGYHYMKINGHWGGDGDSLVMKPFGFHSGALDGHSYCARLGDSLKFFLAEGQEKELTLKMNVAEWFRGEEVWRFGEFGGSIMQNVRAQALIQRNAASVFSVTQ